jgi:hypothetical protein
VIAFAKRFAAAPMLITSQEKGAQQFAVWELPSDIRAFRDDLLRLYLGESAAKPIIDKVGNSGLGQAIRSGYDVRLIADLAHSDSATVALPEDRIGLYAAVVNAAWPEVPVETRKEQENQVGYAAWSMVCERKPNQDIRRLKPDTDLPAEVLFMLADPPEVSRRSVRLIHRAGSAFEFVHDQMHIFLAARWLTQSGRRAAEMERMITSSAISIHLPDTRQSLWEFVAALLDDERLTALWVLIEDNEDLDQLRRKLKQEAERRGLKSVGKND